MSQGRGTIDYRCNGKVFVVKWMDSCIVYLASNHFTHEPLQTAKRRVKKSTLNVPQPNLVKKYNYGMGGVDLLDRLSATYRPMIYGKKWWWPLFLHGLNMTVVAAWRLFCNLHPHTAPTHLQFCRTITLCLLKGVSNRKKLVANTRPNLPVDIRYDGVGHVVTMTSQGRCVLSSANTRSMCEKCSVRLHYSRGTVCFQAYHTSPIH
jgi:hypothetical protein